MPCLRLQHKRTRTYRFMSALKYLEVFNVLPFISCTSIVFVGYMATVKPEDEVGIGKNCDDGALRLQRWRLKQFTKPGGGKIFRLDSEYENAA